jgi:sarcosine oxidase, subunit gamma
MASVDAAVSAGGVRDAGALVRAAAPAARFVFRGRDGAVATAGSALGTPLSLEPCRASQSVGRIALWLGPDEWLLIAPRSERELAGSVLAKALADVPHALVDVSDRNSALIISGPAVEDVLSAGCPLDLDPAAFPVGMCTRTLFAKAEIVLWRTAATEFRIEVARSFLPYVEGVLAVAVRDNV